MSLLEVGVPKNMQIYFKNIMPSPQDICTINVLISPADKKPVLSYSLPSSRAHEAYQ
jgi:hypothetical protein